jgi:hypothetical protein
MTTHASHTFWFGDNDLSDSKLSDNNVSDNNLSEGNERGAGTSYNFRFDDSALPNIPKSWLHYLNGPDIGSIDADLARREMPWLAGASQQLTFRPNRPPRWDT